MENSIDYIIPPDMHLQTLLEQKLQELYAYQNSSNPSQFYIKKQQAFLNELSAVEKKICAYKDSGILELFTRISKLRSADSCLSGVIIHLNWNTGNNIGFIDIKVDKQAYGSR